MDAERIPHEEVAQAAPIHFREFVALIASLMALGALGVDAMLPALPRIGGDLSAPTENARQLVLTFFSIGFGFGQVLHGPLSDRFGRRRVLLFALAGYAVANLACALSGSFALLLAARLAGGVMIAATRVTTVAIVRDCYQGRAMAKVMSTAFMVFMIVPVLAPSLGELVLLFGGWRDIFFTIAVVTAGVSVWFAVRMPETLRPEDRAPITVPGIAAGWRQTLADRPSLGYTLASTAMLAGLYGFLNSIQQIASETFGSPHLLIAIFAATAGAMAAANLFNATLVMRLGTRLISHTALTVLIVLTATHLALSLAGFESVVAFTVLQAMTMACYGLAASNFSAMAMQNMGHIAGTASSVQGFVSVTFGSLLGAVIGQGFDGSERPLVAGFLLAGVIAFAVVAVTERGRLYRPA